MRRKWQWLMGIVSSGDEWTLCAAALVLAGVFRQAGHVLRGDLRLERLIDGVEQFLEERNRKAP
jgi:hypothetical protein